MEASQFADSTVRELLDRYEHYAIDENAAWLSVRIKGRHSSELVGLQAALAVRCSEGPCLESLLLLKHTVETAYQAARENEAAQSDRDEQASLAAAERRLLGRLGIFTGVISLLSILAGLHIGRRQAAAADLQAQQSQRNNGRPVRFRERLAPA